MIAMKDQWNMHDLFSYELCSYPPSLFESNGLPLSASKAQLGDALWDLAKDVQELIPPCTKWHYVLDGGALIHRVTWPSGSTYHAICEEYVRYVTQHYGSNVSIVLMAMTHPRKMPLIKEEARLMQIQVHLSTLRQI